MTTDRTWAAARPVWLRRHFERAPVLPTKCDEPPDHRRPGSPRVAVYVAVAAPQFWPGKLVGKLLGAAKPAHLLLTIARVPDSLFPNRCRWPGVWAARV